MIDTHMERWSETRWRGLRLAHPADWELASASKAAVPGRCAFADRLQTRLELYWRRTDTPPNLRLTLESRIAEPTESTDPSLAMTTVAAPDWVAAEQSTPLGTHVHAARFIEGRQWLMEAVFTWPGTRDRATEDRVLRSIQPMQRADPIPWRAMGIDMQLPSRFELATWSAQVGHVNWSFGTVRGTETLSIDRMGLPDFWLNGSLDAWLQRQSREGTLTGAPRTTTFNGHDAVCATSRCLGSPWSTLRGRRRWTTELAWLCPVERRVYRIRSTRVDGSPASALPDAGCVTCCKPPLEAPGTKLDTARLLRDCPGDADERRAALQLLHAVPYVNNAVSVGRDPDGGGQVKVPLRKPSYLRPPISWFLPYSSHRNLHLDPLGMSVVESCKHQASVGTLIERFATEHKLSLREAQLSLLPYVRNLTERGVLAVAGEK